MKEKLNKILKKTIHNEMFVMEMVFFVGLLIIIFTNFYVSVVFGMYFLGFILIAYSVFLFKFRKEKR